MQTTKLLGAIVASIGPLMAWQGLAFADGGPHGPYSALGVNAASSTAACQRCHAPHRASGANLLRNTSTYNLCTSCHGGGVERTDVVNGVFLSSAGTYSTPNSYGADDPSGTTYSKQLNGGRFGNGVQSYHKIKDAEELSDRIIYGSAASDAADSHTSATSGFKCTSCHSPHGMTLAAAGAATTTTQPNGSTENYRMLVGMPVYSWENTTTTGKSVVGAIKSYTKQALKDETGTEATSGISKFCATCHTDYNTSTAANTSTANASGHVRFVHRENVAISATYATNLGASSYPLPVEEDSAFRGFYQTDATAPKTAGNAEYAQWSGGVKTAATYNGTNDKIVCTTCHNAHGSIATAADVSTTYNRAGTHSLQRFDERAVCQSCHKKNPSY